jgi:hypothetical protein
VILPELRVFKNTDVETCRFLSVAIEPIHMDHFLIRIDLFRTVLQSILRGKRSRCRAGAKS